MVQTPEEKITIYNWDKSTRTKVFLSPGTIMYLDIANAKQSVCLAKIQNINWIYNVER